MVHVTCQLGAFKKDKYKANQENYSKFLSWFVGIDWLAIYINSK